MVESMNPNRRLNKQVHIDHGEERQHGNAYFTLTDDETVAEGRNVQHVQQCCFAGTDFVTDFDQIDVILNEERSLQVSGSLTKRIEWTTK